MFQVTGAFAEFERSMIRQRIRAGLNIIKDKLASDGKFAARGSGKGAHPTGAAAVESKEPKKIERARLELAKGRRPGLFPVFLPNLPIASAFGARESDVVDAALDTLHTGDGVHQAHCLGDHMLVTQRTLEHDPRLPHRLQ